MDLWHYHQEGRTAGPVSREELLRLLQTGRLPIDSLVWTEGMPEWQPANLTEGLAPPAPPGRPPPLPAAPAAKRRSSAGCLVAFGVLVAVLVVAAVLLLTVRGHSFEELPGAPALIVSVDEAALVRQLRDAAGSDAATPVDEEAQRILVSSGARIAEILKARAEGLGARRVSVTSMGGKRFEIRAAGLDDAKREETVRALCTTGFLEFRLVHAHSDELIQALAASGRTPEGFLPADSRGKPGYREDPAFTPDRRNAEWRERLARFAAPDAAHECLMEQAIEDGRSVFRPCIVSRRREMSGEYIRKASVETQAMGQPAISIVLDERGAKQFARVTADYAPGGARNPEPNVFRRLAIVLDGAILSAPVIREAIYGGKAEISGSFTFGEAKGLANALNSGALPVPLKPVDAKDGAE